MKTSITLTVFVILACSLAGSDAGFSLNPRTVASLDFGQALELYYKAFQKIMPCGYAPGNIPVLAPFTMSEFPVNVTNANLKVQGSISNLLATGLSDFSLVQFAYNNTNNRTTFDIIFPDLQVVSEFSLNVWALMAGYPAQMAGNGVLNMRLKDFRMVGYIAFAENSNGTGLTVSEFQLNFFVGDVVASNWNNNWNIALNNFANTWVRDFMLMWVEQIQAQLPQMFEYMLLPIVDQKLETVTMTELIAFFVTTAEMWNAANCTL